MQNNERSNSGAFRKFFQEKGYYIVLFLCIAAVGISGYIFVRSAISEKNSLNDETLSVATTTTVPSAPESSKPIKPAAQAEDSAVTAAAEDPGDLTPASKPDPDETVRAAASSVRVWPVSGTTLLEYSVRWPTTRRRATGAHMRASILPPSPASRSRPPVREPSPPSMRTRRSE